MKKSGDFDESNFRQMFTSSHAKIQDDFDQLIEKIKALDKNSYSLFEKLEKHQPKSEASPPETDKNDEVQESPAQVHQMISKRSRERAELSKTIQMLQPTKRQRCSDSTFLEKVVDEGEEGDKKTSSKGQSNTNKYDSNMEEKKETKQNDTVQIDSSKEKGQGAHKNEETNNDLQKDSKSSVEGCLSASITSNPE